MRFPRMLALCFPVVAAPLARAQVAQVWDAIYDAPTSQADYPAKLAIDGAGNVYVTGRSFNPTTGIPPSPPTQDTITLKYSATGVLLWDRRHDGLGGDDNGRDIAVDPADGSVYVAGHSAGYVSGSYVTDASLVKYDAAGNELWAQTWDGPGASADFVRAVKVDASGAVFVGGYTYNASANPDGLVLRYDAGGNLQWATLVDGSAQSQDYFATIALGPAGEIYAVGQANSGGGAADMLVAKIDAGGAIAWQREFSGAGSGLEYALGLAVGPSGEVYVSGYSSSLANGWDATLLAYDAAGTLLWSRAIDGAAHANDQGVETALDLAGNVYLGGYVNQGASKLDFLLAKYDVAGTLAWQRTWDRGFQQDDQGQGLVVDAAGNATIAGTSTGSSGQALDRDVAIVRWDAGGDLSWTHFASSPGVDDERTYDLAAGPGGTIGVTAHTLGATQALTDVWTIVVKEGAQAYCFGDGSIASCPCANHSPAGAQRGCSNSLGDAARLVDAGIASLANDTLLLTSSGELPSALSIFLQGTASNPNGAVFGDGLRCVAGVLKRLYVGNASGGVASAPGPGDPSVSERSATLGDPLAPGSRRYLQTYYRDPDLAFCPPPQGNSWNVSSGLVIDWAP